jgi:GDP-4-dehydro-6-deoxy-D-mannose reductase
VRILVTGAGGFVGRHVIHELTQAGHIPIAFDLQRCPHTAPEHTHVGDLRNADTLLDLVRHVHPDACIHLGGIAFVPMGWTDPELVFSSNLTGTVNLLEALRQCSPGSRALVVTSAEVYGRLPAEQPLDENAPLRPDNLYAVSKISADLAALLYARRYAMPVMTARPENHVGPGQSPRFVASGFAEQLAQIARSEAEPVLRVGNLENERDFTDVRDVARAYRLIVEKGRPGHAYNIASGQNVKIRVILEQLCAVSGVQPRIEVDPARFRPTDALPRLDNSRIRNEVGWLPQIPLNVTLRDIYEEIRHRHASPR